MTEYYSKFLSEKKTSLKNEYYSNVLHIMKIVKRFLSRDECLHEPLPGHCFAVTELAEYYLYKYSLNLDENLVKNIAQNHDLGEYLHGDVDAGKVAHGIITVKEKERLEHEAWNGLKLILPPALYEKKHNYWLMFEEQKTKESRFVKTVDALETMLFMAETGIDGFQKKIHENDCGMDYKDYELSITYCDKKMQNFMELMRCAENPGDLNGYLSELAAVKSRFKIIYEQVGAEWKQEYNYSID